MQSKKADTGAHRLQAAERLCREVEARGGGGDRAGRTREDRLIALMIFRQVVTLGAPDVRRQRHFPEFIQHCQNVVAAGELQPAMALRVALHDRGEDLAARPVPLAEKEPCARPGAFGRTHHGPPIVRGILFEQENFELSSRGGVRRAEPCRDHAGIIEHHHIARLHMPGQSGERFVRQGIRLAPEDQQPRGVAPGCGGLGD